MDEFPLYGAVEGFALLTCSLPDADLERAWAWGAYDEGVRHAFFRTYEELRELAAQLGAQRAGSPNPQTRAQRILAQYHAAYRDLQALLLGIGDEDAQRAPSEEDWPLRKVMRHIIRSERTFFAITAYALDRFRSGDERPMEMPDEAWEAFWAGDAFGQMEENEPLSGLLAYYDSLHLRVLGELASIGEDELNAPSMFWEGAPMPVQFRLHRFDSHLRQHSVQVEKTLDMLGLTPNEARRLLRLVYAALAEAEGIQVGAPELGAENCWLLSQGIQERGQEIQGIIGIRD